MIFSVIRYISASRQKVSLASPYSTGRRINTLISKNIVVLLKVTSSSITKIMTYHKSYFQKYKVIRQSISSHSNESNAIPAGNGWMEWNKGPKQNHTESTGL